MTPYVIAFYIGLILGALVEGKLRLAAGLLVGGLWIAYIIRKEITCSSYHADRTK